MRKKGQRAFAAVLVLGLMVALAYGEKETELKGFITGRSSDTMSVRTADGIDHQVVLNDETKVQMPKGLLKIRHKDVAWAELIPGLAVTVKGVPDAQGRLVASSIGFSKKSLEYASAIQAGLQPTQEQVAANQQDISTAQKDISVNKEQIAANQKATQERFSNLADYDVKNEVTVYFQPGSSAISPGGQSALTQLAAGSAKLPSYLIEVMGFADSTGNATQNQVLSKDRAEAVIDFLMQQGKVSPRHILAPGAMGVSNPAASNETAKGRKENRRVSVRLLVNKGVTGS